MLSEACRVLSHELGHIGTHLVWIGVCIAGLKETLPYEWEGKVIWGGIAFSGIAQAAHLIAMATA